MSVSAVMLQRTHPSTLCCLSLSLFDPEKFSNALPIVLQCPPKSHPPPPALTLKQGAGKNKIKKGKKVSGLKTNWKDVSVLAFLKVKRRKSFNIGRREGIMDPEKLFFFSSWKGDDHLSLTSHNYVALMSPLTTVDSVHKRQSTFSEYVTMTND